MTVPATDFDIVICGAGPVGAALALFLAETRDSASIARIALIDARTPEAVQGDERGKTRFIAISHGSRILLERTGAWDERNATPIRRIHVSHRGHFGRTLIECEDYGLSALGYVVRYNDLARQLNDALGQRPFSIVRPAIVDRTIRLDDSMRIEIADAQGKRAITARYAIHAEGGLFGVGEQDRKPLYREYGQTAITSFVTCSLPQPATAWERFTAHGPIALLPAAQDGRPGYALVWCCAPEAAAARMLLDDDAFLAELGRSFGERLGSFVSVGARSAYPLGLNAAKTVADGREIAIGNAAQTLHPVAGQGLNLGLRDAFTLAESLREDFDDPEACAKAFAASRGFDRTATIELTDLLPRVFSSRLSPVVAARGAALALLDVFPPLRHVLARQMMNGRR